MTSLRIGASTTTVSTTTSMMTFLGCLLLLPSSFLPFSSSMAHAAAAATATATASPIQITDHNVEEHLQGARATFIMFYGSQCGDCIDIRPEWNRLAADWEGHLYGQVAQVDCDDEQGQTQVICDYFQIQDVPTLVYGGSLQWDFYTGSMDYESLSHFAQQEISTPICSARVVENCQGNDRIVMESLLAKSDEELGAMRDVAQRKLKDLHEAFEVKEREILQQRKAMFNEMKVHLQTAAGKEYDFEFLMAILQRRLRESGYTPPL